MLRKLLLPAVTALALTLALCSQAHAWGGYHVGYTHVGYGGAYHVGRTGFYGGYGGGYGGVRYGSYGAYGGAYRGGAYGYRGGYGGYYGGYHYTPSYTFPSYGVRRYGYGY
jgi:hypothetical protein